MLFSTKSKGHKSKFCIPECTDPDLKVHFFLPNKYFFLAQIEFEQPVLLLKSRGSRGSRGAVTPPTRFSQRC